VCSFSSIGVAFSPCHCGSASLSTCIGPVGVSLSLCLLVLRVFHACETYTKELSKTVPCLQGCNCDGDISVFGGYCAA
ncbi:hypothetical protein FB45DRAFT_1055818, partial [Roridomyces roridus]